MSKLLVEINNVDDIEVAYHARAEIVLLSGNLSQAQQYHSAINKIKDFCPDIWLCLDKTVTYEETAIAAMGVNTFVLPSSIEDLPAIVKVISSKQGKCRFITIFETTEQTVLSAIPILKALGIHGAILRGQDSHQNLLRQFGVAEIGQFLLKCHQAGFSSGVLGALEAPDIPRLLPYLPNWIGLTVKRPIQAGQFGDEKTTSLIRALLPIDNQNDATSELNELGTDKIIIEDFVLPMEIGAYKHEFGKKQKVRFNISAFVARTSANPEDMRHIFSYDLILDGIRNLVALGHVELVETLAERVAAFILSYPRVKKVIVRVDKLELGPAAVGIEIERMK